MAWTKAKATAVVAVVVIVVAGTAAVVVKKIQVVRVATYPNIEGAWEGLMRLDDPGVAKDDTSSTHLVLKLVKNKEGYEATTDWIEKGRKDVPMGKVVYDFPNLRIERNTRDVWHLRVNAGGTEMIFDHAVRFIVPDLVLLKRTTTPDAVPERLTEQDFAPRHGSDLQGYWRGTIGTGEDARPIDIKIAEPTDGTFRAEGDNPAQGANGLPLMVSYDSSGVELALASGAGKFQGAINRAKSEITGMFMQGGRTMPSYLKRADYAAEHARDAERDYSFASAEDLQGHWKGSWNVTFANQKVTIPMALDIAKLPDGSYLAAMSNVEQFGNDDPIEPSEFHFDAPHVSMKWKWAEYAFDGTLQNGKIAGNLLKGGGGFPLVFERSK